MGVIDLDARVKKLEQEAGGGAAIDQIEAELTALDEQINGDGETDLGLAGDVEALKEAATVTQTAITPLVGEAGTGGCFYEVYGKLVRLHFNLTSLTASGSTSGTEVYNVVFNIPLALRPGASIITIGTEADPAAGFTRMVVSASNGNVSILTPGTTAIVDGMYLLPEPTPAPTE